MSVAARLKGTAPEKALSRYGWLAAALLMAAVVFVIDLATPRGVAVGALYIVAVVLTLPAASASYSLGVMALCSGLLLLDVVIGAGGASLGVTITNRGFSLLALALTTLLIELNRRRERSRRDERDQAAALFRVALEAAPDGMVVTDTAGLIRFGNGAAARMLGYQPDELDRLPVATLLPAASDEPTHALRDAFLAGPGAAPPSPAHRPAKARRKDGKAVPVECSMSWFSDAGQRFAIAALRDVSERQRIEERLRATQRMEAIGQLAGGVAHDFNNILAAIISYGQFVVDSVPESSSTADDARQILDSARRATALTQQLLAFSRRQILEVRRVDLNELATSALQLLARLLGEHIELLMVPAVGLWVVAVDPSQLEQVLLNLAVNARDAMPEGGKLTVETANVVLDEAYAREHPDVTPGEHVMLAVSDTGVGMSDEVRVRIFDPFFTTKAVGKGTGLGLSTVYGIVKQAHGHLWVYSELGRGTTFKVYFPRAQGAPEPRAVSPARREAPGGKEHILVVEDEEQLRRVLVRVLRGAGYSVTESSNGLDAMLKYESCGDDLDLLLTDVVMPQMGGRQLAEKVQAKHPGLPVVFMSGYTENAIVHNGVLDTGVVFLQKPFTPDVLLSRVRQVLDATKR